MLPDVGRGQCSVTPAGRAPTSALVHKISYGAVALRTHAFPCFLCNDRHFFFVLAIDEEKKDCRCAYFYALRQILGKWLDPCADGRIIASLRDGSKEPAGVKVKHGALHGTIVCLSLSVIVVCSPHPPLCGPPSRWGRH